MANNEDELNTLREENLRLQQELDSSCEDLKQQTENYQASHAMMIRYATAHRDLMAEYYAILSSRVWRLTKPYRALGDGVKKMSASKGPVGRLCKFIGVARRKGLRQAFKRAQQKLNLADNSLYYTISEKTRAKESETVFTEDIRFSVLVPLYNTPLPFLNEMIDSVCKQTYANWELCLADGSDEEHAEVGKCVHRLARKDKRIVYRKLEHNGGISENTNACMDMATGNYIALFDHDDILHPSALYEMACAIRDHHPDFLYTDEVTFEEKLNNLASFHYKPDFAPDNLIANNYLCHFSVFTRELLEKTGRFRHEYDGSQDHDLFLRLTGNAKKVYHIRKLLYFWRSHKASVASDINSKPYAIDAGRRAVHDYVQAQTGADCVVKSSRAFPTIFLVEYPIQGEPLISVLIRYTPDEEALRRCLTSLMETASYLKVEVLIEKIGAFSPETEETLNYLRGFMQVRFVTFRARENQCERDNRLAAEAEGEYLLFLDGNTSFIREKWIENMLMYAQREDVGAVGAKIFYPNYTLYHFGVVVGLGKRRILGHDHYRQNGEDLGYMGRLCYVRDVSAVCGTCMMVAKEKFLRVNGFDTDFPVVYADVDLCLRLRREGLLNVVTSEAELFMYPYDDSYLKDSGQGQRHATKAEDAAFQNRYRELLRDGDPYFNPNFDPDYSFYQYLEPQKAR